MATVTDPKDFWEKKILSWEEGRYQGRTPKFRLLEWFADKASASLRFRLEISEKILKHFVARKDVVEIGCGSALLAERIIEYGAKRYIGIDIADAAIKNAIARKKGTASEDKINFITGNTRVLDGLIYDLVFSLGLLDWLTDKEIEAIFAANSRAEYFHTISEKRPYSFAQWLHRFYVHASYGHKTKGYVPRYDRVEDLAALIRKHVAGPIYIIRDPRLSFGAIITSLPVTQSMVDSSTTIQKLT